MTNEDDPIPDDLDPDAKGNPLALASDLFALLGFFGLFSCLISPTIAIGVCFSAGLTAVILGMLALKRRENVVGLQSTYAKRGMVCGGIVLFLAVATLGLSYMNFWTVRVSTDKSYRINNAKQIGLALHSYSDVVDHLPSPVCDPLNADFRAGSGLSWRVDILPFIEQYPLYSQFDFAQAWDSSYNLPASNTSVRNYYDRRDNAPTDTRWQVFVGPGTLFDPAVPKMRFTDEKQVPDGTSNTIFFAEATTPVPWASPRDMTYTPNGVLPGLGHPKDNYTLVLFADGTRAFNQEDGEARCVACPDST